MKRPNLDKALNIRFLIVLIFCHLSLICYSQVISGEIRDFNTKELLTSYIVVQDLHEFKTKEFKVSQNGYYTIELKNTYSNFKIVASSNGYFSDTISVKNSERLKKYNFNFFLKKEPVTTLNEVVLIGKRKSFSIKKDTISYHVANYLNGSEQKIEEVIKKLPGIDVNQHTGQIKYKGKLIETVTLDGDNLFGFNYSLGTKNINVNMVEQIEAIDNYSENPLLKGIEQGGKVSLNLELKKGKMDFSGNLDSGSGWFNDGNQTFNMSSNVLGITKVYKSFATVAYNNVGINRAPFDYFGCNFNFEQQREQNFFAEKIIPETQFSSQLEATRANINNQFFGNYNAIYKLNPMLSVKTNLYYLQDRISANQFFQNDYQINNETFTTTDNAILIKKPQQYRGDVEVKYNTSKTSLVEYRLRFRQENILTPTTVVQNNTNAFNTFLNTEDSYMKQDFTLTKKLSDKKALQVSLFHSINNVPQTFTVTPSTLGDNALNDNQESLFKRTFLEGKATYLGSGEQDKYSFSVGANINTSPYISKLFVADEMNSANKFNFSESNIFNQGLYNFNRGNWQISPSYSIRVLNQNLEQIIENQIDKQNNFIFEPALSINYKLNSVSFLSGNLEYQRNTNAPHYFILNQVLISNRITVSNLPSSELQNSQRYSLLYFKNDLFKQFQLQANLSYKKSQGNFFANQNITEATTQINYFFLAQNNSNWDINMQISKYIPYIESTLKFTSNYAVLNFRNIVNSSELRLNQNKFFSNSIFWKTAFEIPINFENTFTYQYSNSKNTIQKAFTNKFWHNTFKIILKPDREWFIIVSNDYFLPNTKKPNEQYYFLDATLRHRPQFKKWEVS